MNFDHVKFVLKHINIEKDTVLVSIHDLIIFILNQLPYCLFWESKNSMLKC